MARGTSLEVLVDMLKAEVRQSQRVNVGVDYEATLKQTIRRTQATLYDSYDWPILRVKPFKVLQAGERYYDLPTELDFEQIEKVAVYWGGVPEPVYRGIGFEEYAQYDSDQGVRADPVLKWDIAATDTVPQIEVWPIPASDGTKLQFIGKRKLRPLVKDSDVADLDDALIVLFAAAEILAAQKSADAQLKLSAAQDRLKTLRANLKSGYEPIVYGGYQSPRPMRGRTIIRVSG